MLNAGKPVIEYDFVCGIREGSSHSQRSTYHTLHILQKVGIVPHGGGQGQMEGYNSPWRPELGSYITKYGNSDPPYPSPDRGSNRPRTQSTYKLTIHCWTTYRLLDAPLARYCRGSISKKKLGPSDDRHVSPGDKFLPGLPEQPIRDPPYPGGYGNSHLTPLFLLMLKTCACVKT